MFLKGIRLTALLGRLFTIMLLTRFNYSNSASLLAIIFTLSTIYNSIVPPFHKEIYIEKVKGNKVHLNKIIVNYIIPLLILNPVFLFILLTLTKFYFNIYGEISPNLIILFLFLINEKIFDEINRFSLTFKKYYPWSLSCICRYILTNLFLMFIIIKGISNELFVVNIILLFSSISTFLPLTLVIKKKYFKSFFYNINKYIKQFRINIFFEKNLIRAWLISLVMLLPTFSERIASLTGSSENTGKMFIAISTIQLISFFIDLQIHSTKKSEIIKNKNLKELIYKTNIIPFSFFVIFIVCLVFYLYNIGDSFENNFISIFSITILGTSILLNSLSLIQEEKLFWSKKYKLLFYEMLIISTLILISFIFLNYNTISLSFGILLSATVRFALSSNIYQQEY